jgi:co-chaperonin GroES (HSP10)
MAWGDVVEVSRHRGRCWFQDPGWSLCGAFGLEITWQSEDGERSYVAPGSDMMAFLKPSELLWRIGRYETLLGEPGAPEADVQPVSTRLLIALDSEPDRSDGGILLSHYCRRVASEGRVVKVGDGVRDVAAGDRVILDSASGAYLDYRGQRCIVVDESAVAGVL